VATEPSERHRVASGSSTQSWGLGAASLADGVQDDPSGHIEIGKGPSFCPGYALLASRTGTVAASVPPSATSADEARPSTSRDSSGVAWHATLGSVAKRSVNRFNIAVTYAGAIQDDAPAILERCALGPLASSVEVRRTFFSEGLVGKGRNFRRLFRFRCGSTP
jgi:hypothetical protein